MDHVTHDGFGLWTKGKIDAALRAEKICDYRIAATFHSFEQQCRPASLDYTPVNFSGFQIRVDFRFDCYQVVIPRQEVEKGAKVGVHG